jgi:short-subunit dehydrogenase
MRTLKGQNAILTGASGGLGVYIAKALAEQGVNLFLVAHPGDGLASLAIRVGEMGPKAIAEALDLRRPEERERVIREARAQLGGIDILVNNAGVEFNSRYDELSEDQIREVLAVNLEAPMILTRLVLPEMLRRGHGHIVNISSLAGRSGPAFQEPYAATKGGLNAFTASLRATYKGTGVNASVVCPGFIEAGIYTRLKARTGCDAPFLLGACPPERVGRAVVRAIRRNLPEIIINRYPVRPLLALMAMAPALGAWIVAQMGVHEFFRKAAERRPSLPLSDREHVDDRSTQNAK